MSTATKPARAVPASIEDLVHKRIQEMSASELKKFEKKSKEIMKGTNRSGE